MEVDKLQITDFRSQTTDYRLQISYISLLKYISILLQLFTLLSHLRGGSLKRMSPRLQPMETLPPLTFQRLVTAETTNPFLSPGNHDVFPSPPLLSSGRSYPEVDWESLARSIFLAYRRKDKEGYQEGRERGRGAASI